MRVCRVLLLVFALPIIAGAPADKDIQIVSSGNEVTDDSYTFYYTQDDKQSRTETGTLTKVGDVEIYRVVGSYIYTGTNGHEYVVHYTADENGYRSTLTENVGPPTRKRINPNLIKTLIG